MSLPLRLVTTPTFERDFRKRAADAAHRVKKKLEWLAEHPEVVPQALRNLPEDLVGLRKHRVGDHRVLLWIDHSSRD